MISLSQFLNQKTVVVFFYPKADTPGCTKEACKFRDEYEKFVDAGAEVSRRLSVRNDIMGLLVPDVRFPRHSPTPPIPPSSPLPPPQVIGISGDGVPAQNAFATKHRLPFTIAADEGDYLRKGFGVPAALFGVLPGRQTFVIDKNGKCVLSFNSATDFEGHVTKALEKVKALNNVLA